MLKTGKNMKIYYFSYLALTMAAACSHTLLIYQKLVIKHGTHFFVGDNEDIRERIAGGLGAFAQHCSVEEVRQMLAGPLAAPSGQPAARMGSALVIANTAQLAPQRQAPPCAVKLITCMDYTCHSANAHSLVQRFKCFCTVVYTCV